MLEFFFIHNGIVKNANQKLQFFMTKSGSPYSVEYLDSGNYPREGVNGMTNATDPPKLI